MNDVSARERPAPPEPSDPALASSPSQPRPGLGGVKLLAERLSAGVGRARVLHEVNLGFDAHKVTAIIGPAGSGKTTLLRCLNRMHEVTPGAFSEGRVLLDGANIYERGVNPALVRRRVGMIFDKPNPFVAMSVRDNVLAGLTLNAITVRDSNELVERVLRDVALWDELKDALEEPAVSLPKGQQQRLCVARCLALGPEVVLMDEPCSTLDQAESAELERLIYELKADYMVVIATQDLQQAARVATNTAFLYKGQLVEYGKTSLLFTRPTVQRTEDYITGRIR